ncbi:unnamed protein product [Sympodiomycopsis kandeliae]
MASTSTLPGVSAAGPSSIPAGVGSSSQQPNTSLYVKNLNTKTKKPELRRQLYALFSTYGKVIDVVATRANGMRGQAFVVFRDLSSATAARRALDGFEFYEKSIKIDYASKPSKASIILEHGPEALYDPSIMESINGQSGSSKVNKVTTSSAQADQKGRERKRAREEAKQRGEVVEESDDGEEEEESDSDDEPDAKVRRIERDSTEDQKQVNGDEAVPPTSNSNKEDKQDDAEDDDDDDDDDDGGAMDMEQSDSEDDGTPGPAPA